VAIHRFRADSHALIGEEVPEALTVCQIAHIQMKRIYIGISVQLAGQADTIVGKRGRSPFFVQVAEKELMRLRQIEALKIAAGAWKDKDHPELKQSAAKWVKKLRRAYDTRITNR